MVDKSHYRKLGGNGYRWVGFDDGLHLFQKETIPAWQNEERVPIGPGEWRIVPRGYKVLSLTEEMLEPRNLQFMLERDLSYDPSSDANLSVHERRAIAQRRPAFEVR